MKEISSSDLPLPEPDYDDSFDDMDMDDLVILEAEERSKRFQYDNLRSCRELADPDLVERDYAYKSGFSSWRYV